MVFIFYQGSIENFIEFFVFYNDFWVFWHLYVSKKFVSKRYQFYTEA